VKKIPTLFVRDWAGDRSRVLPEWNVSLPVGAYPTAKLDGTSVLVAPSDSDHAYWARREIKKDGTLPADFLLAGVDDETGKTVGWVPITGDPEWKWHNHAIDNTAFDVPSAGTYEAVGPHFQGNPHNCLVDSLMRHGTVPLPEFALNFESVRTILANIPYEGIVWWFEGEPLAKIKRRDFGLAWPIPKDDA
jgi:hypothetical protein